MSDACPMPWPFNRWFNLDNCFAFERRRPFAEIFRGSFVAARHRSHINRGDFSAVNMLYGGLVVFSAIV